MGGLKILDPTKILKNWDTTKQQTLYNPKW
jgi:hypothetical protein